MTKAQRRRLHVVHRSIQVEPAIVTAYPVRLRIVELACAGDCGISGRGRDRTYQIRVDSRIAFAHAYMVLLHEWGHAVAWRDDQPDHGPEWGVAHATLWRLMVDWND